MGAMPKTKSEIEKWWIDTERANEAQRTGFGARTLRATLVHLRQRGDLTCRLCYTTADSETVHGWTTRQL